MDASLNLYIVEYVVAVALLLPRSLIISMANKTAGILQKTFLTFLASARVIIMINSTVFRKNSNLILQPSVIALTQFSTYCLTMQQDNHS